jgi:hypothetical protein
MNKTILAVVISGFAGAAMATGPSYNAAVTSSATVSVGSFSVSNISGSGVDFSTHSVGGSALNTTGVGGSANAGNYEGSGSTYAYTNGSTTTWANGIGQGGAGAFGQQTGNGSITVTDTNGEHYGGKIDNTSLVGVNTGSGAGVIGTGNAVSGSYGIAENNSYSNYKNTLSPSKSTTSSATSNGFSHVNNWGVTTAPGDIVSGFGVGTQQGSAFAKGKIGH